MISVGDIMSTVGGGGGVQYSEYHEYGKYTGGYHEYTGDTKMHVRGYHEYTRGCSVHWREP